MIKDNDLLIATRTQAVVPTDNICPRGLGVVRNRGRAGHGAEQEVIDATAAVAAHAGVCSGGG